MRRRQTFFSQEIGQVILDCEEWSKKYREALEALNVSEEVEYRAPNEELSVRHNTVPLSAYTREKVEQMLGQPGGVSEETGAHSGRVETTLIYPEASFTFVSGKLKSLVLRTDYFTTSKGIHVGSSKEDVVRAYGKMFYLTDDGFFYGEKTGIRFKLAGGQVEEIRIWLMYE